MDALYSEVMDELKFAGVSDIVSRLRD